MDDVELRRRLRRIEQKVHVIGQVIICAISSALALSVFHEIEKEYGQLTGVVAGAAIFAGLAWWLEKMFHAPGE